MPRIFEEETIIIQSGGPGTVGNLRWGPQFGNDERNTFGPRAAVNVIEYRLGRQYDLVAQAALALLGEIRAVFPLTSQQALAVFFQLNAFLSVGTVQCQVTQPALRLAGGLTVQGAVTGRLALDYDDEVVAAAIRLVALALAAVLTAQGILTGAYALDLADLVAQGALRLVALAEAGSLGNAQGSITQPALVERGTTTVSGTETGAYVLTGLRLANANVAPTSAGIGLTYELDWQVHTGDRTFTVPNGVTSIRCEVWGAGGGWGDAVVNGSGGGGGGGFAQANGAAVAAGDSLTITRGAGGAALGVAGGQSKVNRGATNFAVATGGGAGANGSAVGQGAGGAAGQGTTGDVQRTGGTGGGGGGVQVNGGGGGGGAGTNNQGNNGAANRTGGAAAVEGGGAGGTGGGGVGEPSTAGNLSGGGGGGESTLNDGKAGADGRVRLRMAA